MLTGTVVDGEMVGGTVVAILRFANYKTWDAVVLDAERYNNIPKSVFDTLKEVAEYPSPSSLHRTLFGPQDNVDRFQLVHVSDVDKSSVGIGCKFWPLMRLTKTLEANGMKVPTIEKEYTSVLEIWTAIFAYKLQMGEALIEYIRKNNRFIEVP
jgi:hypothetical protein